MKILALVTVATFDFFSVVAEEYLPLVQLPESAAV